ncbi:hypothetical protein AB0C06_30195 [Micromonospora inaquosa]|uniref:hypothetical protein n=1 Tax=Micromonospora TaxID=1873 RepID=UPI002ED47836|nr:hypothetical protein OHB44_33130 [Micromonospora sp. NBC_00821]
MPDSTESTDHYQPPAAAVAPMRSHAVPLSSVVTHPANPRKVLNDVLAEAGVVCHGWTTRASGNAALEYVADLTGEC